MLSSLFAAQVSNQVVCQRLRHSQFMTSQQTLEPLPYPVYFVCKEIDRRWSDLVSTTELPPIESIYQRCVNGRDNWSVQTYLQLKRRGLEVYLTPHYIPGKICVTTYDDLAIKDFCFNSYVVACRHDRGRPEICEQRVVQNQLNVIDKTDHFIPHWPQINLKPRDPYRGTKIENLVYKGLEYNLATQLKTPAFRAALREIGVNFALDTHEVGHCQYEWSDYTQADIVLAARNCTEYDLSIKPASKLINAWLAGCPALLGPESAFQQLRKSDLDYIEVRTPEDVVAAIQRLQTHPDLYKAMVENGQQRAKDFTADQIALRWRNLLAGAIAEDYERWQRQPMAEKLVGRPLKFFSRSLQHKQEIRHYQTNIHTGPRLFPAEAFGD